MFRDLRGRTVEGLLVHQADLLRDYMSSALESPDVAIQSRTGSGKTLVGLLIAEWRRRSRNERVVYFCPTNQLVHQVAAQARTQYDLEVTPFTGRKREYDEQAKGAWLMGRTVGVTSYAALFYTRPFFESAQVMVLDDAHAAEHPDDAALDHARSALGALNAPALRGYRALWHYLAGNAAWLAARHGQRVDDSVAREYYVHATKAVPNVRWLADLARFVGDREIAGPDQDHNLLAVIERLERVFEDLGSATNHKFDRVEQQILEGLLHPAGEGFEQSHVELGRLLGYDAGKVESDASPDPWWRADDDLCIVFEDHAGAGQEAILTPRRPGKRRHTTTGFANTSLELQMRRS